MIVFPCPEFQWCSAPSLQTEINTSKEEALVSPIPALGQWAFLSAAAGSGEETMPECVATMIRWQRSDCHHYGLSWFRPSSLSCCRGGHLLLVSCAALVLPPTVPSSQTKTSHVLNGPEQDLDSDYHDGWGDAEPSSSATLPTPRPQTAPGRWHIIS